MVHCQFVHFSSHYQNFLFCCLLFIAFPVLRQQKLKLLIFLLKFLYHFFYIGSRDLFCIASHTVIANQTIWTTGRVITTERAIKKRAITLQGAIEKFNLNSSLNCYYNFLYHKALIPTFHTSFQTADKFCEFTPRTYKLRWLFCTENPVSNTGFTIDLNRPNMSQKYTLGVFCYNPTEKVILVFLVYLCG